MWALKLRTHAYTIACAHMLHICTFAYVHISMFTYMHIHGVINSCKYACRYWYMNTSIDMLTLVTCSVWCLCAHMLHALSCMQLLACMCINCNMHTFSHVGVSMHMLAYACNICLCIYYCHMHTQIGSCPCILAFTCIYWYMHIFIYCHMCRNLYMLGYACSCKYIDKMFHIGHDFPLPL